MSLYTKRKVQTLSKLCLKKLENNPNLIIKPLHKIPYFMLETVVKRCTPEQLLKLEKYNEVIILNILFHTLSIYTLWSF